MATTTKVSKAKQQKVLDAAAIFLGKWLGHVEPCGECVDCQAGLKYDWQCSAVPLTFKPAPTGPEAAASALGPQLIPDWDWPSSGPTPSIVLEGGEDWAYAIGADETFAETVKALGLWTEPYAGYALCIYPA